MWDTRKIVQVWVENRSADEIPGLEDLAMGQRTVVGLLETGEEVDLFSYFDDEISFDLREFPGLPVSLARRLRRERELAYLQS
jgi:hypothetical protein